MHRPHHVRPVEGHSVAAHQALAAHPGATPHAGLAPHDPGRGRQATGDIAVAPAVTPFAPPPPAPPPQGQPASTPTAVGGGGRRTAWRALTVLGALALAVPLLVVAADHHHGHHPPAVPPVAATQPTSTAPGTFTLPNPYGNAVRTVPIETTWVIDSTLPASDLQTLTREAPTDVQYLASHALTGDLLGYQLAAGAARPVIADQSGLAATAANPATVFSAPPAGPITLPAPTPGHDQAVVVITANPQPWATYLPQTATPPAPTAGSHPLQRRTYIVVLDPGSGAHRDPLTASAVQPQTLTADPSSLGDTARALARAFVDAIGASWPG